MMHKQHFRLFLIATFTGGFFFNGSFVMAFEEERSRISLQIEAGLATPIAPSEFSSNYKGSAEFGGRIRYDLTEHWAVAAGFASQTFKGKENLTQQINTQPLTGIGFYSPVRTFLWNPYAMFGLGVSRNQRRTFAVENEWTKLTGLLGLGVELKIAPFNTVSLEGTYRYYAKASKGDKDFQATTIAALMNFYLPYDWIPDKPKKPLMPMNIPEAPAAAQQAAEKQQAQEELNKVQQDILDKKIPSILFEIGKAVLIPESAETLDIVGTILKRYPQFSVRVEGHTDNVGTDLDNMVLSQSRAEVVRQYLIQNFTVPTEKISALGFGETQPIADNDSEDGRQKNRRVEFKIIQ